MRQTFSTTYSSEGAVKSDNSGLLLELFENTYYHLTGRSPAQEGYVIRILSTEDYWRVADEEGASQIKASAGWCCRHKEDGIHIYVNADNLLPQALSIVFHEVGHGLHRILNPGQWRDTPRHSHIEMMTNRAFVEAIAMAFEAANLRVLGEQTGVETSHLSDDRYIPDSSIGAIVNSVAALPYAEIYGLEGYDRGRLLIWTAVLYDPELSHLRAEFEANGRLSGASLYEIFLKFVNMDGADVHPYIASVTPESFEAVGQVIQATVQKRTGKRGLEYPELSSGLYDSIVLP